MFFFIFDIDAKEFGDRLRNSIKTANITQKDLSDAIGVSKTTINNYVGGRIPDASILYKLSKTLGVSMEWLISGEEASNTNKMVNREESELLALYSSCCEEQKKEIVESIKSYLKNDYYNFKKPFASLSEDELKIIELFRNLSTRDKIKIEGVIESKISESKDSKKGELSTCKTTEEEAAKKHA